MAQSAQPNNAPIRGFHVTEEQAIEMARRGIQAPSADALIRAPKRKDEVLDLTEEDHADTVRVVCFVDTKPWTHERPLDQGEQAVVPRKVAHVMHGRHQVTIIE